MSKLWLYKLKPGSAFHFSDDGAVETTTEVFHSDSFFGALAMGVRMCYGESVLSELLEQFQVHPPFKISSLLPYSNDILFLPALLITPLLREVPDKQRDIRIQDIRFMSQGIMELMMRYDPMGNHLIRQNLYNQGSVWITTEERVKLLSRSSEPILWSRHSIARSTIDRLVPECRIHYTGQVRFAPGCGLYFFLDVEDESSKELVDNALNYLSDAGLGGERSAGYGHFSIESIQRFNPFWSTDSDTFATLSLYHPTLAELNSGILAEPATYQLIQRRGWVTSPERSGQRRKSVSFFTEGSVLRSLRKISYGDMVDVTPELQPGKHTVFRYGYAFPIGMRRRMSSNES